MATVVFHSLYLFEDQNRYVQQLIETDKFFDKQDFFRRAIEAAIQARQQEEKKIANLQSKEK